MYDFDDRLDKQELRTEHVSLTCRNHTNKRYSTKNMSGRSLFFLGEACEPFEYTYTFGDCRTETLTFKRSADMPHPMHLLKCRMQGRNPYDARIEEEPSIKTLDDVREFIRYVEHVEQLMAFECDCPASDLVYLHTIPGQYTEERFHGPWCGSLNCGHA